MSDFWVPRTKAELVKWLGDAYPEHRARFRSKTKKQLYAIYYSVRRGERAVAQPVGER